MSAILIIDDQPDSRDLLLALLAPQGHRLTVARDGVEGLALARAERPDLIITDILMPEMDGYDLARHVRADPWLAETRIIFYTATYLASEVRDLASECGVEDIIIKPTEPETVLEIVRAALRRPPPAITLPPSSITDREYLRLMTRALHRKVEELGSEVEARQAAEQSLRESERRFRDTFEHAAVGIAHVSPGGRWLRVNQRLCAIVGYSRDDLLQRTFQDLTHPADLDVDLTLMRQVLDGIIPTYTIEKRYFRKDGALIWVELTVALTYDGCSGEHYFISMIQDISDRKRAAEEIRQLNARLEQRVAERTADLQAALEQTEALYRITRTAVLSEDLSRSLQQIVEQIAADLPAHHVVLLLFDSDLRQLEYYVHSSHGSELASQDLTLDELMEGFTGWAMRERCTAISSRGGPDPRESPALQRRRAANRIGMEVVTPLLYRGEALGTLTALNMIAGPDFSASDVSLLETVAGQIAAAYVRARLYESLRQAREEAEQASRAKSEFLSSMSHELRTPLNAVIGFTGTLLMRLPGPLNPMQEKQLRTIQTNARHLLSLINDLLDVARIEAGKVEIQLIPTDVLAVVDAVAASLRPLAEEKGLRFLLTTPPAPITLASDQRALSQIMINLVNNAIKFTERGEVRVVVAQIAGDAGAQVQISVLDTGVGIKAEHQHRLFKAFERAGVEGARRAEGTGLGLHLSLQLARLLGGTITFQSEYAVGSRFTLVLPIG